MRGTISSKWTLALRILPLVVFTTSTILALVNLLVYPSSLNDDALVGTIMLAVMTITCYWWFGRLKTVRVSQKSLYVSNWRKEISIPITEVEYIYYFGAGRAVIRLKSVSEFGRNISFLVPLRLSQLSLVSHPVVEELRATVKSQRYT